MTREDIKQICQIYESLRKEQDAATIAYNSDDTFWEHVLVTYNLSQFSLPSNIDEAAQEYFLKTYGIDNIAISEDIKRAVKFGAEWLAKQGRTIESFVWLDEDDKLFIQAFVDEKEFKMADHIIIQIRKK